MYVHVNVFVVQRADEVVCEACAAFFSHLFLFIFYLSSETSKHFLSPSGVMRIQINYKSQKTMTTRRHVHMVSNVCICECESECASSASVVKAYFDCSSVLFNCVKKHVCVCVRQGLTGGLCQV